jgi:hypothetical protein
VVQPVYLVNAYKGNFSPDKLAGAWSWTFASFGTEVKNGWNCIYNLPYAFMTCTRIILCSPAYTCIR